MKCIIPGLNVKVFGRAVHSLSKLGDEVYIEPMEHGLALRTVSNNRAAYGCFIFAPSFFHHYDDGSGEINSENSDQEVVKCKLSVKSCLTVFKNLSNLEKTVDRCKITMKKAEARLVFQLYCKHGIVKTHNLAFVECETLQAVFSKDLCPNQISAQSRLLSDVVLNFQTSQEEISLIVKPEKTSFKNYIDSEGEPAKAVNTELSLDPDEFENYQVGVDTEVTFSLREMRAMLAFTESANLPVSIYFESPGRPIVFSIDSEPSFEGSFVLATMADVSSQVSCSQQTTQNNSNINNTHRISAPPSVSKPRKQRTAASSSAKQNSSASETPQPSTSNAKVSNRSSKKEKFAKFDVAYQDFMNDDMDELLHQEAQDLEKTVLGGGGEVGQGEGAQKTAQPKQTSAKHKSILENGQGDTKGKSPDMSPVIPQIFTKQTGPSAEQKQGENREEKEEMHVEEEEEEEEKEEEEKEDLVPGTPPSKKFKSMFFAFSQSTTAGTQPQPTAPVLAEDTDEEDD